MHYQPDRDVIYQKLGDDILLLHVRTNRFYELNNTAARVWELISTGSDLEHTVVQLASEFNAEAAVLMPAVEAVITSMTRENLLKPHAAA
jgi:hypothetical protein